jgi:hypothetical protein
MSAPTAQPNTIQLAAVAPQILPPADTMLLYFDRASGKLIAVDSTGASIFPPAGVPGGSDGELQFNDAGSLAGTAPISWDKTAQTLSFAADGADTAFEVNLSNGDTIQNLEITPNAFNVNVQDDAADVTLAAQGLADSADQAILDLSCSPAHVNLSCTDHSVTGHQNSVQLDGTLITLGTVNLKLSATGSLGFYGSAGTAKPAITGSKGANAALASLLTALAALGLLTDSTT